MPVALILFSLLGIAFFGIRLIVDPAGWPAHALGIGVSVFVGARNAKVVRSNRRIALTPTIRDVSDPATLDEALASDRAILYKHSTVCPVSAEVIDDVLTFARSHPEWPLYVLKVIEERDLSDAAAQRLGVPHASPQAIVIREGHSVWHASHYDITTNALAQQTR